MSSTKKESTDTKEVKYTETDSKNDKKYQSELFQENSVQDEIIVPKGMKEIGKKLSLTISKTWNAIDEHEELLSNRMDHFQIDNVLQKRLSNLTIRQSKLQILLDGTASKNFVVPDNYDGPKLPPGATNLTQTHLSNLIAAYQKGKVLHYRYAHELVGTITQMHISLPNLVQRIQISTDSRLTVVGDLHGQLQDLFAIFEFQGLPSKKNCFLFNGDFVDRGSYSIEVLFIIYVCKILEPESVWLNRGNHEHPQLNKRYKFEQQVKQTYDERMYERIASSFKVLPLCTIINNDIFVVHGGLTEFKDLTLADIEKIKNNHQVPKEIISKEDKIMKQLVWSDPWSETETTLDLDYNGFTTSSRGAGIIWSPAITYNFLKQNKLLLIIRSHQMVDEGFKYDHGKHVVTLFSASYYCGKNENKGAIAIFNNGNTRSIKYIQYYANPIQLNYDDDIVERTTKQTLQKLANAIHHKRYKIFIGMATKDVETKGYISVSDWAEVLNSSIEIKLNWPDLWVELFKPKDQLNPKFVQYRAFLDRFTFDLRPAMNKLRKDQQEHFASIICDKILANKHKTLEESFHSFSSALNNKIKCIDYINFLITSNIGFSKNTAMDFISTLDINQDSLIDLSEFKKRFQNQFPISILSPKLSKAIYQLGDAIYSGISYKGKNQCLQTAWQSINKTDDGYVLNQDFEEIIDKIGFNSWTNKIKSEVFKYINKTKTGKISFIEFKQAFAFRALVPESVIRIFSLLQNYALELLVSFQSADQSNTKKVDKDEFVSVLYSVFEVKKIHNINEKDIYALFNTLSGIDNDLLDYHEMINGFKIICLDPKPSKLIPNN